MCKVVGKDVVGTSFCFVILKLFLDYFDSGAIVFDLRLLLLKELSKGRVVLRLLQNINLILHIIEEFLQLAILRLQLLIEID